MRIICVAGVVVALSTPVAAPASERFVSPSGSDASNDCSASATPCATIAHALTQAGSGDSIKTAAGRYPDPLLIDYSTTLTILGGWRSDFSGVSPTGAKSTVIAAPVSIEADSTEAITVTFDRFTFAANGNPGALAANAVDSGTTTLVVTNSVVRQLVADPSTPFRGVSVSAAGSGTLNVSFANSTIARWSADGAELASHDSSSVTGSFVGCTVAQNKDGGLRAVGVDGSRLRLTVADSTFSKNQGASGGGLLAFGLDDTYVDVTGSVFKGNKATGGPGSGVGGAISVSGAQLVCWNSTFTRNKSTSDGGAISVEAPTDTIAFAHLVNDFFIKNVSSSGFGGGTSFFSSYLGTFGAQIANCTFVKNRASSGGGLAARNSSSSDSSMLLLNDILFDNVATTNGTDVALSSDWFGNADVYADHDDIGGLFNNPMHPMALHDQGGNISADPALRHQMILKPNSPAVDAGTCSGAPTTDFEGDPRPSGGGCDIGADEFVP